MSDKPRTVKSPAQRAQEAVDVLIRRRGKLTAAKADLEAQAKALDPEIEAVQKRLDYAKVSPDLAPERPAKETPPVEEGDP